MEKKRIFLASASELKDERSSFARFIREINEVMKLQSIELEAEQWEFKDKAIQGYRIQDMYNNVLSDCEICVVLFWTRCGKYSQEELSYAYDRFKEGLNPRKIYVFFKNDSSKQCSEELISYKREFPQKFCENFPIEYSTVDELRYLLFLEIAKYFGNESVQIRFDNKLIDFSKLPCFKRNKDYAEVLSSYNKASKNLVKYPNDKSFFKEKELYEAKLNGILADLVTTAKIVERFRVVDYVPDDVSKAINHFYQKCQYDEVKRIIESVANPFKTIGEEIKPEFYCDRLKECERFDKHLMNGENLLLISPRRSGKTVFFQNRMRYSSSLSKTHYFAYCDLWSVRNIEDFARVFSHSLDRQRMPHKFKLQGLFDKLPSIKPVLSLGLDGQPNISIDFSAAKLDPVDIINDCFKYLEELDKPCVLCFDEFQQLNYIDSRNQVEAIIYNQMNNLENVRFMLIGCPRVYSDLPVLGIKRSIIERCTFVSLDPIRKDDYQDFAQYWFGVYSKEISATAFSYVYDFCKKSPYYIQKVLHRLFMETRTGEVCRRDNALIIIDSMIREAIPWYNEIIRQLTNTQTFVLYHFCLEGTVCDYPAFVKRLCSMGMTPTKVTSCVRGLIDKEIISYYNDRYYIEDVFLGQYLKMHWKESTPLS